GLGFHRRAVAVLAEDNGMVGRGVPHRHPRVAGSGGSYPNNEKGDETNRQRQPKILRSHAFLRKRLLYSGYSLATATLVSPEFLLDLLPGRGNCQVATISPC